MNRKTFLVAGLSALLVLSAPIHAAAAENQDEPNAPSYSTTATPRYSHIESFYAECDVTGSTANVYAFAAAHDRALDVSLSATLQKLNGSQWQNVKTWTSSGSGAVGASLSPIYAVTSGTYRVKVTAKVMDGTKTLETATIYG